MNGEVMEDTLDSLRILQLRDLNAGSSKIRDSSSDSASSCLWIGHKVDIKKEVAGSEGNPTGWLVQNIKNRAKKLSLATKNFAGNTVKLNYLNHVSSDPAQTHSPAPGKSNSHSPTSSGGPTYSNSNAPYNFCNPKDCTLERSLQNESSGIAAIDDFGIGCKKLLKKTPKVYADDLRLSKWKYRMDQSKKPWYSRPNIVNKWLKTLVNGCIALLFFLMVGFMVKHIHEDMQTRLTERDSRNRLLAKECENHYMANKCKTASVPYLINQCEEWEMCMRSQNFGRQSSSLYAKLLAEVLNSFFSTLEYRTVGLLAILTFSLLLSSALFSMQL